MLLMGVEGDSGSNLDAVGAIVLQLLVPFVAGQLARRWIGAWVARNAGWLKSVDQGSILLVVYTAFSDAVVSGLWSSVPPSKLLGLTLVCCVLLALVLWCTRSLGRWLGFSVEDRITILFAGSKKSMATGVPMAQLLFAGGAVGALILPLMLFHQIQLMVCAVLAQRYAGRQCTLALFELDSHLLRLLIHHAMRWLACSNRDRVQLKARGSPRHTAHPLPAGGCHAGPSPCPAH